MSAKRMPLTAAEQEREMVSTVRVTPAASETFLGQPPTLDPSVYRYPSMLMTFCQILAGAPFGQEDPQRCLDL